MSHPTLAASTSHLQAASTEASLGVSPLAWCTRGTRGTRGTASVGFLRPLRLDWHLRLSPLHLPKIRVAWGINTLKHMKSIGGLTFMAATYLGVDDSYFRETSKEESATLFGHELFGVLPCCNSCLLKPQDTPKDTFCFTIKSSSYDKYWM